MEKKVSCLWVAAVLSLLFMPVQGLNAQSVSSDKAFFGSTQNGVTVSDMFTDVTLLSGQIKTSNVGAILAGVSMECALWTDTITTATSGGGKNTSTAQAAVTVTVLVDGVQAEPGQVVFCDRLQSVGLSILSTCTLQGVSGTCTTTNTITLELFQATKNANHFDFYIGNPQSTAFVHNVVVKATGMTICTSTSGGTTTTIACPSNATSGTKVAIGKASLVLENINNTNL
jgi:hypothetical protein